MSDAPPSQEPRSGTQTRRKHPFRDAALEKYQRAAEIDTPELTLQWLVLLPLAGVAAVVLAVLIW